MKAARAPRHQPTRNRFAFRFGQSLCPPRISLFGQILAAGELSVFVVIGAEGYVRIPSASLKAEALSPDDRRAPAKRPVKFTPVDRSDVR